jgi:hypothetical protein
VEQDGILRQLLRVEQDGILRQLLRVEQDAILFHVPTIWKSLIASAILSFTKSSSIPTSVFIHRKVSHGKTGGLC